MLLFKELSVFAEIVVVLERSCDPMIQLKDRYQSIVLIAI